MNRIRIIHVVHSLGTGGTEEGIRKLLAGLAPSAFEQIVCTVASGPTVEPRTGARVISLGRAANERGMLIRELRKVFVRERPQVVHSRNWGAIEAVPAARLAGIKAVIHSEHGLEADSVRQQPLRRKVFRRLCFSWADRVFAVSDGLRSYYAEQLKIAANRLPVIPNGVDTERFQPDLGARKLARQKLNVGPETLVIGTVGRLDPVKDHGTLFEAAELALCQGIPLHLAIVGDGPLRKSLTRQVEARSLLATHTTFLGETSNVPRVLNGFDVFVLPSLAEGMSNALLEAMATGVASVATSVGGNPELIEEGSSGLLFEAGNARALANYLRALALDPQMRRHLGVNARKRVEDCFSLQRMLANYAGLYQEAVGKMRVDSTVFDYLPAARS